MDGYAPSGGIFSLPSKYNGQISNRLQAEGTDRRVLACLASHPDDELLSAGALLVHAKIRGYEIHLIWATKGTASVSFEASRRWDEALELGKQLSASVDGLGMKDGSVDVHTLVPRFDSILSAMKPHVVVCPHGWGPAQHQDHRAVHDAFANVARRTAYAASAWIVGQPCVYDDPAFTPNLFLGFENALMNSVHALMQTYRSERQKCFFAREFFEWRGRRWAHEGHTGTRFAEAFFLYKGLPPADLFMRIPSTRPKLNESHPEAGSRATCIKKEL